MLDDRDYIRRAPVQHWRSATLWLVAANVLAFLVQQAAEKFTKFPVDPYFALSLDGLQHGFAWQVITFQFMHGGWLHLILNCWAIWMFGREVEETLGRRNFLKLYFLSGVFGGLVQIGCALAAPHLFGGYMVGASAGAFGLIAAFAVLFPERPLTLLLMFVIPINMRAKLLLLLEVIVSVVGILYPRLLAAIGFGANVGHAAHLGGMIAGVLFVRYALRVQMRQLTRVERRVPPPLVNVPVRHSVNWNHVEPSQEEQLTPDEFLARQVDPILEKITAHGIQSLNEQELRILEAARARMSRR
jgi:membrane associated rhomboid family serine protease